MEQGPKGVKKRNHSRSAENAQTSISMRADIIELGKQLAKNDMRTFSNWLAIIIAEEAKRRGVSTEGQETRED
jgi:hypothetical protein